MVDTKKIEELRALVFASMPSSSSRKNQQQLPGMSAKWKRKRGPEDKEEGELSSDEETTRTASSSPFRHGSEARVRTPGLDKVGDMNVVPHLSAAFSTKAMPLGGIHKEAEAFLTSLNIPLAAHSSRPHSMPGEKIDSLVIKFSDEDSDSDGEHEHLGLAHDQHLKTCSENRNITGNGLLKSVGVSVQNTNSLNQSSVGLKTEIDRVKRQIAAMERMKGKTSANPPSGKVLKSNAMDVSCQAGATGSKLASTSGALNSRVPPVDLESLRQQIAAKESELQLRKQGSTKDSRGPGTSLANTIMGAGSVSAQAVTKGGQSQIASSTNFDVLSTTSGNPSWMIGLGQDIRHMQSSAEKLEFLDVRQPVVGMTDMVVSKMVATGPEGSQTGQYRNHIVEISDALKASRSTVEKQQKCTPGLQSKYAIEKSGLKGAIPVNKVVQTPPKHKLDEAQCPNESLETVENEGNKKQWLNQWSTHMQSISPPKESLEPVKSALPLISQANDVDLDRSHIVAREMSTSEVRNEGFSHSLRGSQHAISNTPFQSVKSTRGMISASRKHGVELNSQGKGDLKAVTGTPANQACHEDAATNQVGDCCRADENCQETVSKLRQGTKSILSSCEDHTCQLSTHTTPYRLQAGQSPEESLHPAGIEGPSSCEVCSQDETEAFNVHKKGPSTWDIDKTTTFNLSGAIIGHSRDNGVFSHTERELHGVYIGTNSMSARYPSRASENLAQNTALGAIQGGFKQDSEFRYQSFQQLQEEEGMIEEELEVAQQNRHECEARELLARRQYREAQEALYAANLRCDLLYQKREMLAARIQAAQIQYHSRRVLRPSAQPNEGALVSNGIQGYSNMASFIVPAFWSREERQVLHVGSDYGIDQGSMGPGMVSVSSPPFQREVRLKLEQMGSLQSGRDQITRDSAPLQVKRPDEQLLVAHKDTLAIKEVEQEGGGHLSGEFDWKELEGSLGVGNIEQKLMPNLEQVLRVDNLAMGHQQELQGTLKGYSTNDMPHLMRGLSGVEIVENDSAGLQVKKQDVLQNVVSECLMTIKQVETEGVQGCLSRLSDEKVDEVMAGARSDMHGVQFSLQQEPGAKNLATEGQHKSQPTLEGVVFPVVVEDQVTEEFENGASDPKVDEMSTIIPEDLVMLKETEDEEVQGFSSGILSDDGMEGVRNMVLQKLSSFEQESEVENLATQSLPKILNHDVELCEKNKVSEVSAYLIPSSKLKVLLSSVFSLIQDTHDSSLQTEEKHGVHFPVNLGILTSLSKYESPLCTFRSYRAYPQFHSVFNLPIDSNSWSHHINPHKPLCMYELRGKCNNDDCPWQHGKDYTVTPLQLLDQMKSYGITNINMRKVDGDLSSEVSVTSAVLSGRKIKEALCMEGDRRSGCITRAVISKSLHLDWNRQINKPPIYHVGPYLVKADCITASSHLTNFKQQFWKLGFCQSFSIPLPIHRQVPLDMPCLIDPLARDNISAGALGYQPRLLVSHIETYDKEFIVEEHFLKGLEDAESLLEVALSFINFDLNSEKSGGRKSALYVLSRALEAKPNAVILWVVYLNLFYRREKSVGKDDMFHHAVQYNIGSYELWTLFINSRKNLVQRLEAYENAIIALANIDEKMGHHSKEQSSFILDLALQMLNVMCMSNLYQEAISWITDLTLFASEEMHTLEGRNRGSAFSLLLCVTKYDACILWVSCANVIVESQLPASVIVRLGCKQKVPLNITWKKQMITKPGGAQAMKLMHTAVSGGIGCLSLDSGESCQDKDTQLSFQAMAVNFIQCAFACEGLESARTLGRKYIKLYPTSTELILLCVQLEDHHGGSKAGLETFEAALSLWPQSQPGMIRLWCQYAAYALTSESIHYVIALLARCAALIKGNNPDNGSPIDVNASASIFAPASVKQSRHHLSDNHVPTEADIDGLRQAFQSLWSVFKCQSSGGSEVVTRLFSNQDVVFGFLILAFLEALEGDMTAAQIAADKALRTAFDEEDVRHCLKEIAALTFNGSAKAKDPQHSLLGKKMLEFWDKCCLESERLTKFQPLSGRLSNSIKRRRVRLFVDCILSPAPVDCSLLNSILETCYGPGLLPEKNVPLKELFDFVEKILQVAPTNTELAISACRIVVHRLKNCDVVAKTAAFIWSSSLLINSLFQSCPLSPEHYWLEAGHFLELLGIDSLLEDFYLHAVAAYPFSVLLWHRLLAVNNRMGKAGKAVEAARQRVLSVDINAGD